MARYHGRGFYAFQLFGFAVHCGKGMGQYRVERLCCGIGAGQYGVEAFRYVIGVRLYLVERLYYGIGAG